MLSATLMHSLIIPATFVLGLVALVFGSKARWAYVLMVALGLLYFPARVGFQLRPSGCQIEFNLELALLSLRNFSHIIHFAWFFIVTAAQFSGRTLSTFIWSGAISLLMGLAVELGEGLTGKGNCRIRDLVPDAVGALVGASLLLLWNAGSKVLHRGSRTKKA